MITLIQIQAIYWTNNDDVMAELGHLADFDGPDFCLVGVEYKAIELTKVVIVIYWGLPEPWFTVGNCLVHVYEGRPINLHTIQCYCALAGLNV